MARSEVAAATIPIDPEPNPENAAEWYNDPAPTAVNQGVEHSLTASAPTSEEALREARRRIPADTTILSELEISPPLKRSVLIKAENEDYARAMVYKAYERFYPKSIAVALVLPGRKGLCGIGRKPSLYLAEVMLRNSRVEIRYTSNTSLLTENDNEKSEPITALSKLSSK